MKIHKYCYRYRGTVQYMTYKALFSRLQEINQALTIVQVWKRRFLTTNLLKEFDIFLIKAITQLFGHFEQNVMILRAMWLSRKLL